MEDTTVGPLVTILNYLLQQAKQSWVVRTWGGDGGGGDPFSVLL